MKVTKCLYCKNGTLELITHRSDDNPIIRCKKCHVMMVENISDDTAKLYTSDYFEKDIGTKNGYTNYLSSPVGNLMGKYAFARLFSKTAGVHLDLGAADGSLIEIFKNEGYQTSGLEISADAATIANQKGLSVLVSNIHSFPKGQTRSDVITAFDLLEHSDQPGKVLHAVYENLNDGGYFCFSTLSVKKNDPSDYWFNNSLEHYIYYNQQSLNYILSDIFGEGNYLFTEIEVNGVAEFWGVAKKGKITNERKIMQCIDTFSYDKKDAATGYYLSLFYNQASQFDQSAAIINHFSDKWTPSNLAQARFYNNFYQGKFEVAVADAQKNKHVIPANSVFWQALSAVEEALFAIKKQDMILEANNEIITLREQLFDIRDQLHNLKNSRVVGRIIKARDFIGDQVPRVKHAPRKVIHIAKPQIAKVVPGVIRRPLMRAVRHDYRAKYIKTKIVANKKLNNKAPLLSVVVPYYNRADTIDDTLQSLEKQTYVNFETIIIDDGSTDQPSIQKLEHLKTTAPNVTIIHQENSGVASARNAGIASAKGKYIICLDSDDILQPTYIEKVALVLETNPDISIVTTHMEIFGVRHEIFKHAQYDPLSLYKNNTVITAAAFRKEAWKVSGGYKSKIGYEDWEYWLTLGEHGFWAKLIPEPLFKYRTSLQSRYVEDKDIHWNNLRVIRSIHAKYKANVKKILAKRQFVKYVVDTKTAFVNLNGMNSYTQVDNSRKNILIAMPWMTFGGAETLILNFCKEIKNAYNLSFVTGLQSDNEWEYKFKDISNAIYHLPNLFDDESLYLEFMSNYISTHQIDVLHMIHTDFVFRMLPELRKRHPELKIAVTMFNDRVPHYFQPSIELERYIDTYISDNQATANHYRQELPVGKTVITIPNGIDCYDIFNPILFDRELERKNLKLTKNELAVFFVGRLSEEKNPNIYLDAAQKVLQHNNVAVKFYMIGDGGMRGQIEKQIAEIDNDNIIYLGYQTDIAKYLSAADVFVLPSSVEGFPLSILEAMAMHVAVIASDVGAVGDVVNSGIDGFVVTPGSTDEISDAILKLFQEPQLLNKIQLTARSKLEAMYSSKALGRNYKKLYKEILK